MRTLFGSGLATAAALVVVTLLAPGGSAPIQAQEKAGAGLTLPLRVSAWAINMTGTAASGRNNILDIRITRWTTEQERASLLKTAVEKNQDALLRALTKLPTVGRVSVPGWRGPDPHKLALGWNLHYAWHTPGEDGGHRIVLGTDRYMSMWEVTNNPRSADYPFTLLDLRLPASGEGEGKASVATKISFDKKKNIMELENYGIQPALLQQVKITKQG